MRAGHMDSEPPSGGKGWWGKLSASHLLGEAPLFSWGAERGDSRNFLKAAGTLRMFLFCRELG